MGPLDRAAEKCKHERLFWHCGVELRIVSPVARAAGEYPSGRLVFFLVWTWYALCGILPPSLKGRALSAPYFRFISVRSDKPAYLYCSGCSLKGR